MVAPLAVERMCIVYFVRYFVYYWCCNQAGQYVYEVMRLYVHCRETKQQIKWQQSPHGFRLHLVGENKQYRAYSYVRTWKSRSGAFPAFLGQFYEVLEQSPGLYFRKHFRVVAEIVFHGREYSVAYIVDSHSLEIVLRAGYRQK